MGLADPELGLRLSLVADFGEHTTTPRSSCCGSPLTAI